MSIRSILLTLDEPDLIAAELALALPLARRLDARLTALQAIARPTEMLMHGVDGVVAGGADRLIDAIEEAERNRRDRIRECLEAACAEHDATPTDDPPPSGFAVHHWLEIGEAAALIAAHGRVHDLVVTSPPPESDPALAPTLHAALFETGRPLLLAPAAPATTVGNRVVVAWNGGVEAARALSAAADLMAAPEAVLILGVDADDFAGPRLEAAAAYLERHGIAATVKRTAAGGRLPAELLLNEAESFGADLLVMGAYGRSRLRESILGGVTRDILTNPELPVLMAH